jgi:toxin ParE1/3/4
MVRIIRTSAAEADLADIWSYIAADNSTAADKLLAQIDAVFALIGETPKIGFAVEDIKPGIRCKPVKRNYLIFYQIIDDQVFILRVLHSARKYEDLL